jgi:TetR/AcrR family transcriptional repressor of nem operon
VDAKTQRDRLLRAAVELFARRGVADVGVAEICRRAEVPKGSFYHAWPSKQALLLEAIDLYVAEHTARIRSAVAEAGTLREQLLRMFDRLQQVHVERQRQSGGVMPGCTTENLVQELAASDEAARAKLAAVYAAWQDELQAAFEAGVQRGEIDVDPVAAATSTLATLQGATLLARTCNDPGRLGEAARAFVELLPWNT